MMTDPGLLKNSTWRVSVAKSRFLTSSVFLLTMAGGMFAQGSAQTTTTVPAKIDFALDVQPILRENCVSCHGPLKQQAGMRLDRKSSVMKAFSRRVVPGSSENSFLYHRIMGQYGSPMPPDGSLKPAEIATIKDWIDQGAEWPDALANEVDLPPPGAKALAMVVELRTNNLAAFMKAAAAKPALLNARGPQGATPFMFAVLYTSPATISRLLAMGADANAHDDANATALMWAAKDLEKTRILLEHGGNLNVKSDDLRTPLMIAARKPGGAPIVKLMIEHGANVNPNTRVETESSPLVEALTAGDAETTALLMQHGANAKAAGETGLSIAAGTNCLKCLDMLAPNVTDKNVYTASLQDIAVYGDLKSVQLMLDHGADVKAYDPLGRTALMYAVVSDMLPLDVVKLLIDHGADVNARCKHTNAGDEGLTVLDMAKRNGDTPIVRLLEQSGAKTGGALPVVLTPRLRNELHTAIQDSIPLLQQADVSFASKSGCVSCHNNSLTAMTVGLARKHGFQIDERAAASQVQVNVEGLEKIRDRMYQGFLLPVGDNFSEGVVAYMLLGLAAEHHPSDLNTDAAAIDILGRQQKDGEWFAPTSDTRPPICLNHIGDTALSMRALQLYAPKADASAYRRSIQMAAAWLAQAKSYSNDDRGWRLAGLAWAGSGKPAIEKAKQELMATQKADGSWADQPTMESTAYATGKSLVALQISGLPTSAPAYQAGVKWLLSHQLQDGTWYVQTRALAFQPYFDAGFPHGHDQWISTAGTNWATMALALAMPESKPKTMASSAVVKPRSVGGE
jgi:ankyrin repeat protein